MKQSITINAPAKINLFLDITGKRTDGYHTLTGVMQTVNLCDTVTVTVTDTEKGGIILTWDTPTSAVSDLPCDRRNIAYKAAESFLSAACLDPTLYTVHIHITKRIPSPAGLAGGSSDAAAVLKGLNLVAAAVLPSAVLPEDTLYALALKLGADVPFCLHGGACITEGIGEQLTPTEGLCDCELVLAFADEGVSTPAAYRELDGMYGDFSVGTYHAHAEELSVLLHHFSAHDPNASASHTFNLFETVILPRHTEARTAKQLLLENGALSAMMSGSGPAVFGIFPIGKTHQAVQALTSAHIRHAVCTPLPAKGIAVAGTTLVDVIKEIDRFPQAGMLTTVRSVSRAVGGLLPNVAIDLAAMDSTLPLTVCGPIGNDENGMFVKQSLASHGIMSNEMTAVEQEPTGFTDVMSDLSTGERTFFTMEGANRVWIPDSRTLDRIAARASILHIGYVHLMPALDAPDREYGTVLAHVLHDARERGLKTSVDTVSRPGFEPFLRAALPYADYLIVNEIEACALVGVSPRDENGQISIGNLTETARVLLDSGVHEAVVIHCPEMGLLCRPNGSCVMLPSLELPRGYIKGSTGAGDAFCAACLYGLVNLWSDEEILRFASAAAACNLSAPDAVSGMRTVSDIWAIDSQYPRKKIGE